MGARLFFAPELILTNATYIPQKNSSLGLLLTLSDSCEKALFEIHGFVEDELAHFKLKELAEKPGE